jgi:hypothetical protein
VRVSANRAPDALVGLGDCLDSRELVEPGADRQDRPDTGGECALNDGVALGREIGEIEMAMAVD